MGSLSFKNWNVKYLLCIIDILWVKPLKDEKGKTVLNAFIQIINDLFVNQISYGLIKEKNFTKHLRKNG